MKIVTFQIQHDDYENLAYVAQMPSGKCFALRKLNTISLHHRYVLEQYTDLAALMTEYSFMQENEAGNSIYRYTGFRMDTYIVQRDEDITGRSGEGDVCTGVIFPNGMVVQEWLVEPFGVNVYDHIDHATSVHSHGGKSRFEFAV